jgi:hypothetical protein
MRALVPLFVILLSAAALGSALDPHSAEARAASAPTGATTALSARGLWADAHGNTMLVAERLSEMDAAPPWVELRRIGPEGRLRWAVPLGEGVVGALVDSEGVLYLSLGFPVEAAAMPRSRLIALEMHTGAQLWTLEVEGEVTDLLADGAGGLRARSLRGEGGLDDEHLLSVRAGQLLWDLALSE